MIGLPLMATVIRADNTSTSIADIDAPIVGVKRYANGAQYGSVYRLKKGATDEEKQCAEDRAMLDTLHSTGRIYV